MKLSSSHNKNNNYNNISTGESNTHHQNGKGNGGSSGRAKEAAKTRKNNNIPGVKDGWFSEVEAMWPGQKFSLALDAFPEEKSVLYSGQSDFQSILIFRSAQYGNVLVLDGVIQLTERDEFAYHEMIAHLPLFSHPNPKNVLIVGGGDGGVLREVCRHDCVQNITLVDIDPMVIEVARKYFGESTAMTFDDDRLKIVHEDAAEFLRRQIDDDSSSSSYDVIIADTSDPVGPAETLFQPDFYETMNAALSDGGIVCAQGECFWIHLDLISDVVACCGDIFDSVEYASAMVPTYPCGQIGFILCGKGKQASCRLPIRKPGNEFQSKLKLYNPAVHKAAFVLPQYVEERLSPLLPQAYYSANNEYQYEKGDDNGEGQDDCFLSRCIIS